MSDIDPDSGCRLPLPRRDELDAEGRAIYDRLANPADGSLRGLRGPGGILLHSPELARRSGPVNRYLRFEAGLSGRLRELAILAAARCCDSQFVWAAHEQQARREGVPEAAIEALRQRRPTAGLDPDDALVIEFGREIFVARRVAPETFARALRRFGRTTLVNLVALMGNYAATAALLTAFDMQLDPETEPPFTHPAG